MKPIAICRHEATQGPAYLQTFLEVNEIPFRVFAIDAGDTPPSRSAEFSAIVVLGSNSSANDKYSWIQREDRLLQDALQRHRPILGHCFGGQMLARALGAKVRRNSVPQIGWGKVLVTVFPEAKSWMGEKRELDIFHWHEETFEIPRGAKRVLFGSYCMNKGFFHGQNLALQSHLEVTADSIRAWCNEDRATLHRYQNLPSVQSEAQILHKIDQKVAQLHHTANHVYTHWLSQIPNVHINESHFAFDQFRPRGGPCWGHILTAKHAQL